MLEVKDVSIAAEEKILLKNLSFMAKDGQLTCITGRSGVGKTDGPLCARLPQDDDLSASGV